MCGTADADQVHKKQNLCSEVALLEWRIPFVLCTELRHILEGMTSTLQNGAIAHCTLA
jgi:hypothetical protein